MGLIYFKPAFEIYNDLRKKFGWQSNKVLKNNRDCDQFQEAIL